MLLFLIVLGLNFVTCWVFFCRVTDLGDINKMQLQNIAIVFGPTVMRPQVETMSMAIEMVHQSSAVEQFLREYDSLFTGVI